MTATTSIESFIEFLIGQGVLKFGDFTLNSGRQSPYFFNLGSVSDGQGLQTLGRAYADAIVQSKVEFDAALMKQVGSGVGWGGQRCSRIST